MADKTITIQEPTAARLLRHGRVEFYRDRVVASYGPPENETRVEVAYAAMPGAVRTAGQTVFDYLADRLRIAGGF